MDKSHKRFLVLLFKKGLLTFLLPPCRAHMTAERDLPSSLFSGIDITDQPDHSSHSRRAHRELAAHQLRTTGLSARRIAEALDVPHGLVARWLSDAPAPTARLEKRQAPKEPIQEQTNPSIEADALVALRAQFRACMAQVRGLADRLDRVEEREQQRLAALEKAMQTLQGAVDEQMAALRASLAEAVKANGAVDNQPEPAAARRPRLAFWRRRDG
jgi:predicted transcriptional regulator